MPETISWPEAAVYIYTGSGTASALVSYCNNINVQFQRGWVNNVTLGGVYYNHLTGKRANVTIQAFYTFDGTLVDIDASATAIHMHLKQSNVYGSAGYYLYSGRIDTVTFAGSNGQVFTYGLQAHFNQWSAYNSI